MINRFIIDFAVDYILDYDYVFDEKNIFKIIVLLGFFLVGLVDVFESPVFFFLVFEL